jgi:adenylate cyclase
MEEVFDLQDRITDAVVNAIAPEIRSAEIARTSRKRPERLDAYDHYLQALAALHRARLDEAESCLDQAIARSPTYAKAKALKSWCGTLLPWLGRPLDQSELNRRAMLAEEVLDALDTDPEDEAYAGYTIAFAGRDYSRGLRLVERATDRCPSLAWAWTSSAMLHAYRGRSEIAIEHAQRALRLSPRDPMAFRIHMAFCFAYLSAGNYDQVLDYANRGLELNPRAVLLLRQKIVALAHLDRLEEARIAASQYMAQAPTFSTKAYSDALKHLLTDAIRVPIVEGLRLAGLPE